MPLNLDLQNVPASAAGFTSVGLSGCPIHFAFVAEWVGEIKRPRLLPPRFQEEFARPSHFPIAAHLETRYLGSQL
jgi:hypothetical protein